MISRPTQQDFFIHSRDFEPAYMRLYRRGTLQARAESAIQALENCELCPRNCESRRAKEESGVCEMGRYAEVASFGAHHGEEAPLSGWRGSGTIFFAQCNLRCVFCQNYEVSHFHTRHEVIPETLADMMLDVQLMGCHNVNLVSPGHVVPQILEALVIAIEKGLRLPLVYNTSGYDALRTLKLLNGVVDIYMPDFKFWNAEQSRKYLRAADYPQVTRTAIREMYRQVGDLKLDENHIARHGLIVRHLVMPGELADTGEILHHLAQNVSPNTYVNLMDQYYPAGKVDEDHYENLNRRITPEEYERALKIAQAAGLWRIHDHEHSPQ
ncbi:MAG: radical SAM protein [Anaerolineales bacterium]